MLAGGIEEAPWLVGPWARVAHSNPRGYFDARAPVARANVERRLREVMPVERARDAQGAGKAPGPIEPQPREAFLWLAGAHEDRMPAAAAANDVEAVVHSVDEEHIGVCLRPEERPRALGETRACVAGEIPWPAVRFGFHDSRDTPIAGAVLVHEQAPHERARNDERVARVPLARKASRPKASALRSGCVPAQEHSHSATNIQRVHGIQEVQRAKG